MSAIEIVAMIESDIDAGALNPGDRVPSVRDQARLLGVSPTTVAAAYKRLRERGRLVGRGRQGSRVAPGIGFAPSVTHSDERGSVGGSVGPPFADLWPALIDAASGNPDQRFLPSMAETVALVAVDDPVPYGSALITPALGAAAVDLFTSDGIDASNIAVTSGAMDAIDRTLTACRLAVGDRIGVEDPGHVPVHQIARRSGLELVSIMVDEHGAVPDSLRAALARGIKAVVLTPRAHNPTGAAFTTVRGEELSAVLADFPDVTVIVDDHAGVVSGVGYVGLATHGGRWAVVRSMAKSFGQDLRVAVVAGDRSTIAGINELISTGPGWVSYLLQNIVAHHLESPVSQVQVKRAATAYGLRRQRLIDRLGAGGVGAIGTSGLNVWVPVPDEQSTIAAAGRAGFVIRGGDPYRLSSPSAVRVTISGLTGPQIDDLADALVRHLARSARSAI